MGIVERDGKYFIQLLDGEKEITLDELAEQTEATKYTLDFLKNAQSIYDNSGIEHYSVEPESYIKINVFFDYLKKAFDQDYHTSTETSGMVSKYTTLCKLAMQEFGPGVLNPFDKNKSINEYFVTKFKAFLDFIELYPIHKPNPAAYTEFSQYLKYPEIIDNLKIEYTNVKPQHIAYMLFALEGAGVFKEKLASLNQTDLHNCLLKTFGKIGTRQMLNINISNLTNSIDSKTQREIKKRQEIICNFLAANNAN